MYNLQLEDDKQVVVLKSSSKSLLCVVSEWEIERMFDLLFSSCSDDFDIDNLFYHSLKLIKLRMIRGLINGT